MKSQQEIQARINAFDEHLKSQGNNPDLMLSACFGEAKQALEWVLGK